MEGEPEPTSIHVQRAGAGDVESTAWIVARFTPLLRAQAEHRLRGRLRRVCDAEDLVNEVWATTLPRLGDLRARSDQWTPVLLKFMATTLLNKINHVMTEQAQRELQGLPLRDDSSTRGARLLARLPAEISSVVKDVQRSEACELVEKALQALAAEDREALVLRGVEQLSHAEIARHVGTTVGAVTMRYRRALERLRDLLPGEILDELPSD